MTCKTCDGTGVFHVNPKTEMYCPDCLRAGHVAPGGWQYKPVRLPGHVRRTDPATEGIADHLTFDD